MLYELLALGAFRKAFKESKDALADTVNPTFVCLDQIACLVKFGTVYAIYYIEYFFNCESVPQIVDEIAYRAVQSVYKISLYGVCNFVRFQRF